MSVTATFPPPNSMSSPPLPSTAPSTTTSNKENYTNLAPIATDVFQMDRANHVISSLITTVNEQSKQIRQLQQHQSHTVNRSDLTTITTQLQTRLTSLEKRLATVEKDTSLTSPTPTSIGSLVSANRRAIARSLDVISSKVSQHDLTEATNAVNRAVEESRRDIVTRCVTVGEQMRMREVVESLTDKIKAMEGDMTTKANTIDLLELKMDATTIRAAAKSAAETNETLTAVANHTSDLLSRVASVEEITVSNVSKVSMLSESASYVQQALPELATLSTRVNSLRTVVEKETGRRKDLERVEKVVETHGRRLGSLSDAFETVNGVVERTTKKLANVERNGVAKVEFEKRLSSVVDKKAFHEAMVRAQVEIDAKCWTKEFRGLRSDFARLKEEHDGVTRVKANLGTKFVDWYGQKGEVYERNLEAMDGHLKNLAVQSYTKGERREPYSGDDDVF